MEVPASLKISGKGGAGRCRRRDTEGCQGSPKGNEIILVGRIKGSCEDSVMLELGLDK